MQNTAGNCFLLAKTPNIGSRILCVKQFVTSVVITLNTANSLKTPIAQAFVGIEINVFEFNHYFAKNVNKRLHSTLVFFCA